MINIKAVIFDLDDTLYDCSGTLVEQGRRQAAKMLARITNISEEKAYRLQGEFEEKYGTKVNVYEKIVTLYNLPNTYINQLLQEFICVNISNITLFSDVVESLVQLKSRNYKLFLVTSGEEQIQKKKIDVLGLNNSYFDDIFITDRNNPQAKRTCFYGIIQRYNLKPEEIICVGDKIDDEIAAGKSLGIITVMFEHGRHYNSNRKNQDKFMKPHYSIKHLKELLQLKIL